MNPLRCRGRVGACLLSAALLAIASTARAQNPTSGGMDHRHMAGMDLGQITIPQGAVYTEADVRFMQGMIAHHAQAIYMSRMAAAHDANAHLLKFATKIDQSQRA